MSLTPTSIGELKMGVSKQSAEGKELAANLSIEISSGRTLILDYLTLETQCADWEVHPEHKQDLPLLAKRNFKDFKIHQWFDSHEMHFIDEPEFDCTIDQPGSVLITALLYSKPISQKADFSELIVVFKSSPIDQMSIKHLLTRALQNLDWNGLAIDRFGTLSKPV
jgi:hypothetical protein